MQKVSIKRYIQIVFAGFIVSLYLPLSVHAAEIKCPQIIKLSPGVIDENEYALNLTNGCNEVVIDVKAFKDKKIQNLKFLTHDLAQSYSLNVLYADSTKYNTLYENKDIPTNNSNACNSFKDAKQPKFALDSCFQTMILGIEQTTEKIKLEVSMLPGSEPESDKYIYIKGISVNSGEQYNNETQGGENFRKIKQQAVCGNYKFHDLDAVFTGQVTNVTSLANGDENYSDMNIRYRFEVEKVLKGAVVKNEKLVLLGNNESNVLQDKKYYLIYAKQLREDKFQPICIKQLYSPDDVPEYLQEPFDDIQNVETFRPYIVGLYYNGIVSGYGDSGYFYPEQCVKRSHLAKFLVNTFGFDINTAEVNLPDVIDPDSDLDQSILTLYKLGIVKGYSNGYYLPDECVTREQAAAFIVRALQYMYPDIQLNNTSTFPDITNSTFAQYIAYLYNIQVNGQRVINGNSAGYFEPSRPLTRAEMSKMMYLVWLFKNQYRDVKGVCLRNGGTWLESAKECEGMTNELCAYTGGVGSCQSRNRVRLFAEEEVTISVQSGCSQEEITVCKYNDAPQYTPVPTPVSSTEKEYCVRSGNVYVSCEPCKVSQNACPLICNLVNKCVNEKEYCVNYIGGTWSTNPEGCAIGVSNKCENYGGRMIGCQACATGQACAAVCNPVCRFGGQNTPTPIPTMAVPETRCREKGGTWIAHSQQCNGLNEGICAEVGGKFNSCGSPCGRYYSGMCANVCAKVCYID